uniref:XRE family transcriptional regulator n=1 Tax=Caenorhabditis tropicalis TaxID=1561998 RepID=A0A1I7UU96_9PELO
MIQNEKKKETNLQKRLRFLQKHNFQIDEIANERQFSVELLICIESRNRKIPSETTFFLSLFFRSLKPPEN